MYEARHGDMYARRHGSNAMDREETSGCVPGKPKTWRHVVGSRWDRSTAGRSGVYVRRGRLTSKMWKE